METIPPSITEDEINETMKEKEKEKLSKELLENEHEIFGNCLKVYSRLTWCKKIRKTWIWAKKIKYKQERKKRI